MRHLLGLSGGKDSSALAIFLRDADWSFYSKLLAGAGLHKEAKQIIAAQRPPRIEYFFTDTGKELPEVYDFISKLEVYLGQPIIRPEHSLGSKADSRVDPFDHFLIAEHGGMLPSQRVRWCTYKMKLRPLERYINGEQTVNYVGLRKDEPSRVKISSKENIHAVYPFIHAGLVRDDIIRILEKTIGVPEYYEWRTRSGCYFCFFQRRSEWLGLLQRHPDLYIKAMEYEEATYDPNTGRMYQWIDGITLRELAKTSTGKNTHASSMGRKTIILKNAADDDPHDHACAICSL